MKPYRKKLTDEGLNVVGWREVPIDASCLGVIAMDCLPRIEQVFVDSNRMDARTFATRLFVARRQTEIAFSAVRKTSTSVLCPTKCWRTRV